MQELQSGVVLPKKLKSKTSTKTISLVGQPNSGKSTLFNALSDVKVSTANFAGTTVEYKETIIDIFGNDVQIIDLPGIYSLNPTEPAEFVTLEFLLNNKIDLIVNVIDSTFATRSFELTVELSELGIPMVIALNMSDEANRKGISIDTQKLTEILNIPAVKISALYRKGIYELLQSIEEQIFFEPRKPKQLNFTFHIERLLQEISDSFEVKTNNQVNKRFYAIKILENFNIVNHLVKVLDDTKIKSACEQIIHQHQTSIFEAFAYERHHYSMEISHKVINYSSTTKLNFTEKLDLLFLKPLTGYFFATLFFALYFFLIFIAGGWLSEVFESPLSSLSEEISKIQSSTLFGWFVIDGIFQGISGAIGIVLPYFLPLLFLTAILEETGYMSRIAYLMDAIFHRIGLHGKSVASFVMGFGCTVPAVYATRIIESRRDRLLASVLINFIPCSARLTVIFALTTALTGPIWAVVIFAYVLIAIAVTAKLLSLFLPKPIGLIMEIPPLRIPSISVIFKKTYYKILEFFKVAFPFLILGSLVLSILDYFHITQIINNIFQPFIHNVLGLPKELGSPLVFGFLRKELAVFMTAQSFGVSNLSDIPLTIPQVVTFLIFIVFYLPCVSTTAVFWKEFGWKHLLVTIALGLTLSTISAVLFRFALTPFF
ncbi:ferrous iron transport protein B [Bacteroidetes/Chlorobi group bacterium Naka2016]|nr:MAG: ferrous iron transport protein B [Bacteroidetes/Chlorobi group bacterium Naka2016]